MTNVIAVETNFKLAFPGLVTRLITSSAWPLLSNIRGAHKAASKPNKRRDGIVNVHFNISNIRFNVNTLRVVASSNRKNFTIKL